MVKIRLQKPEVLNGKIKSDKLVSPEKFVMGLIAKNISTIETVDRLIGQSAYIDKIEALQHQTRSALHVLNNFSHRALLADEVGLGKTIEAGIIIKEYIVRKLAKKILILVPATLKYQWQEEMRSKFEEDFHVASNPEDMNNYDKIIASIDTAKTERYANIVKSITWDLIIIDEAHKLKNSATQNYKLVKGIKKERCLMLTATPLQNNMFELWSLIDLLHPGFLGTKARFTEEYITDKDGLKVKNSEDLQEKLGKIMIRNLRRDTGIKFPERIVKNHILSFSKEEMSFYSEVIGFIRKQYEEIKNMEKLSDEEIEEAEMNEAELKEMAQKYRQKGLLTFGLIMLTRQITSSIKTGIEALKRYKETLEEDKMKDFVQVLINQGENIHEDKKMEHLLKILKNEKDKVIVFTTFMHTQKTLAMELSCSGFSTVNFNGTMTPEEKEKAIQDFKGDKQILICTDAGSEGRNLQFAHILINYDLPWNPMRIEQRIGRVHRIGQKKDVEIHNIAIKDTIESYILNRLYEKIKLFTVTIGEMDMILSELKTSGSIESTIFDSAMKDNDDFVKELEQAKEKLNNIKKFDEEVFDKKK